LLAAVALLRAQQTDCTFKAEPDAFLDSSAKAYRAAFAATQRLGKGVTTRSAARSGEIGLATANPRDIARRNFIDDAIFNQLDRQGVRSARLTTDEEFVRRIYLDLTGRIPTPAQIRAFLADADPAKRSKLIDALLESPEFTDKWVMWFGDLLGNARNNQNFNLQDQGRAAYHAWIQEAVAGQWPIHEMVKFAIAVDGNNFDTGATNWQMRNSIGNGPAQDTFDNSLYRSARDFLGMSQYDCILCHNGRGHLEETSVWGKSALRAEAQRMAAFFSRTRMARPANVAATDPYFNSRTVTNAATGQYDLNTTSGNRPPRTAYGTTRSLMPEYRDGRTPRSNDWRGEFGSFLVTDPMFARNFANRIWKAHFNQALVEPVDQLDPARLDPSNPPAAPWSLQATHPELLERLARELTAMNFDLRSFVRLLVNSSAYQLSSSYGAEWKLEYQTLHARHYPRRLEGEEVHDAIVTATGLPQRYTVPGLAAPVDWAMQLPDPTLGVGFMNSFYRGNRDTTVRLQNGSILQQLGLMNDVFVTSRVKVASSAKLRAIAGLTNNQQAVEELFLTFVSRMPTAAESESAQARLQGTSGAARNTAIEDLAWVMVNKLEFIFNY
jgi:hypothetical protein